MAGIQGTLTADFSSFSNAVENAVVQLRGFEASTNKVESAMTRMTDNFSGRKIITEATLMQQAVENVGGVSHLTEAELAKVSATAGEAAAKLRAMGQDVPPGLQKIADAAKDTNTQHQALESTVRSLVTGFVAMFTARAAFNFVKDTVNEASALNDLSQQTHMSVEEIQHLAGAMSEFGVDQDTLAKGLYKLSRGIAGGDESVATGLHLMGLSLKDVEGLNGKELFLKIEGGLATLQGGLRDTSAADLFGGKLGMAMAGAAEGIGTTMEKWERLNTVASKDSVEAMDAFGESVERANKNLTSIAMNMMGPVAAGFNTVYDAVNKGASKWAIAVAMLKDWNMAGYDGQTGTEHLTKLLDDLNQKTDANAKATAAAAGAHGQVKAAVDNRTAAEKFLAALEADAAVTLDATQLKNLAHLKEIGELNAKNAAGIGVNATQFAKYTAGIEAAKKATQDLAKAEADYDAIQMIRYANTLKGLQEIEKARLAGSAGNYPEQIAAIQALDAAEQALAKSAFDAMNSEKDRAKVVADLTTQHIANMNAEAAVQLKLAGQVNAGVIEALTVQARYNASIGRDAAGAVEVQDVALKNLTSRLIEIAAMHTTDAAAATLTADAYRTYSGELETAAQKNDALDLAMQAANEGARQQALLINGISGAMSASDVAMGTYKNAVTLAATSIADLNRQLTSFYDTLASRSPAGDLSGAAGIGSMAGPSNQGQRAITTPFQTRDVGGPVTAGQSYLIGRPELFTPGANGFITPLGGGGTTVVNHIYVNGTAADVARQVAHEILKTVQQGAQLS